MCVLPLRVGSCHVTDQATVGTGIPVEKEWQMAGEWLSVHLRRQHSEAVSLDELMQLGKIGFGKSRWNVHGKIFQAERRSIVGIKLATSERH
jgi:hypothetical protein